MRLIMQNYFRHMTKEELENYADKYLTERFGAKTGNAYVRQALLDGYSLALHIHDVAGRSEQLCSCSSKILPDGNIQFSLCRKCQIE
jgi:hypothetical protein